MRSAAAAGRASAGSVAAAAGRGAATSDIARNLARAQNRKGGGPLAPSRRAHLRRRKKHGDPAPLLRLDLFRY